MGHIATSTALLSPLPEATASSPIHQAIDCLTVALIEVQIVRRQLASGRHLLHPMRDDALTTVEAQMHRLAQLLLDIKRESRQQQA